jgi:hypothetical protein
MSTNSWSEHLKGSDHLKDIDVRQEHNIKIDLKEIGWQVVI